MEIVQVGDELWKCGTLLVIGQPATWHHGVTAKIHKLCNEKLNKKKNDSDAHDTRKCVGFGWWLLQNVKINYYHWEMHTLYLNKTW